MKASFGEIMIEMQSYRWFFRTSLACLLITVLLGVLAIDRLLRRDFIPVLTPNAIQAVWPRIDRDSVVFDAAIFRQTAADLKTLVQKNINRRFRLAGTFFAVGINQQSRKAILDDLQKKEQLLVTEGDLIENEARVQAIMSDRVILRRGSVDEQIMLCFANSQSSSQQVAGASSAAKNQAEAQSRFGKRVGDKRWVLSRAEILNYYAEVLNNTDRLAKIYDSLKPVYDGQKIAGYTLMVEGEGEMFNAFGLQPGDVIRQVNSMPMTSQSRAEYFISEFVKNRVNGFVLDIERSGRKEKMIYMIR